MNIPFITKQYPSLSWFDNFMSGHLNLTKHITIFGQNAMHWSMTIYDTKWGHLHIDLPTWSRLTGKRTWCAYASPNGTPWACTWYIGTSNPHEKIRAAIRRFHFGHNFKWRTGEYKEGNVLYDLNDKMDSIFCLDYFLSLTSK